MVGYMQKYDHHHPKHGGNIYLVFYVPSSSPRREQKFHDVHIPLARQYALDIRGY